MTVCPKKFFFVGGFISLSISRSLRDSAFPICFSLESSSIPTFVLLTYFHTLNKNYCQ
ncbi:MAG: hypothetical protein FWE58_00880 [Methanobrevibacter sp.]|nr:hypothetical protein [Methanobrevibacter sp.]